MIVSGVTVCHTTEDVGPGHKIALLAIPVKGKVIRYGEVIVEATHPINPGDWVHIHNTEPLPTSH